MSSADFETHLEATKAKDGSYDLAEAERSRADEMMSGDVAVLAAKAASKERKDWEKGNSEHLRKQFMQPALSPELDREVKVKLGDNVAVRFGDMNQDRMALRLDLRTSVHVKELRAYTAEYDYWASLRTLLDPDQNIDDLYDEEGNGPRRSDFLP